MPSPNPLANSLPRIKLNVGGTRFEISSSVLQSAGDGNLLAGIAHDMYRDRQSEVFLDRDPELFKALLFVLRSKRLPSKLEAVDLDLLINEAKYYGVLDALRAAMVPRLLNGLDLEKVGVLHTNGRDFPSVLGTAPNGSLCLAHGSKITFYDWALRCRRTTLTELSSIESLHMLSESHVAIGAANLPGAHVYDVVESKHKKTFMWADAQDLRVSNHPSVHAITSNPTTIFLSFCNAKAGENTIGLADPERLEVVGDIGRQRGTSTVATKLEWMGKRGLLVAGSKGGDASEHAGQLRLFDVRSKEQIWEWKEPSTTGRSGQRYGFADWATAEEMDAIFKLGVESGGLELLELRMMKEEQDPWLPLQETRQSLAKGERSASSLLVVSGKQVFCSRGGDLEVWNEVPLQLQEFWETSFRRNYVDQRRNMDLGHVITAMAAGGNRLFVARKDLQGVEVWETRALHR